jgi:hypothetical protein
MTEQQVERERLEALRTARLAVRHLLADSKKPALLLLTWTRETLTPVAFPNEPIFKAAAQQSGCRLARVVRPVLGSYDHYLFLTKVDDLSDDQLMGCTCSKAGARWNPVPLRQQGPTYSS